jgi:nucleoside 2-deoxyribosyltransferase
MKISVIGGSYYETCLFPNLSQFFGSGGRAAALLSERAEVDLHTYCASEADGDLKNLSERYAIKAHATASRSAVHFSYPHGVISPRVRPRSGLFVPDARITVEAETVLVYGMMEGAAEVRADALVYDPQSASPDLFKICRRGAKRTAIVLNHAEAARWSGEEHAEQAAATIRLAEQVDVVVVKCGAAGAIVSDDAGAKMVPAYFSERVVPLGSGDAFSAAFAMYWALDSLPAEEAADLASRFTSQYVNRERSTIPTATDLKARVATPVCLAKGKIYLAGPFFSMQQRRLVEEALAALTSCGVDVFSPLHEVGMGGSAKVIAEKDLEGLRSCSRMLALLEGFDPGTVFEVGYARARDMPVFAFSELSQGEALTMIEGSGCVVIDDFASAIYRTAWGR